MQGSSNGSSGTLSIARQRRGTYGGTWRPAAEHSISCASRRSRVSSRLALITQWIAVRR